MGSRPQTSVCFPTQLGKPVHVEFDAESLTSDAGAPLLGSLDRGVGLTKLLAETLLDRRDSRRVRHDQRTLIRQRVYGLVLGYEDCNDAQALRGDPSLKVALGRGLEAADDLASTATLCRFENAVPARSLVESGRALTEWRLKSLRKRFGKVKRITIDLDSTPDPTHGQQQFSFFDGHYDTYCFKPLLVWVSFDDDDEQYLVATRLRPGKSPDVRTVIPFLRRLVARLRASFAGARLRVRADAGFGKNPRLLDVLDELEVEYLLGIQPNSALKSLSAALEPEALKLAENDELQGEDKQVFCGFQYRTQRSWPRERRVVAKAEVTKSPGRAPKLNLRYVVTGHLDGTSPRGAYRDYRMRGDPENRVKEIKQLDLDRTSCTRFCANALRVLLTTAAYMLFQELRWRMRRSELRRADVNSFRTKLLKVAARVVESVRRFVFHLPTSYPWSGLWRTAARAVGAVPT